MQGSRWEDVEQTQQKLRGEVVEQCQEKHPLSLKKINKAVNRKSGYAARSNQPPLLGLCRALTLLAAMPAKPLTTSNVTTVFDLKGPPIVPISGFHHQRGVPFSLPRWESESPQSKLFPREVLSLHSELLSW